MKWTFAGEAKKVTVRVESYFQINEYLAIRKLAIEDQGNDELPAILCGQALRYGA